MELPEIEARIDELKSEIDALRPIDADTENRIMQKFRLDWNYHSNNLEGNSLTFGETKTFLLHGITAEGKPLKDHLDLKGHNEAILLLDDVVKNERPLTEAFIRELHQIILHEPYDRPAVTPDGQPTTKRIQVGQYKSSPNHVKTATGEIFYFATPEETPAKMNDLMDWYAKAVKEGTSHPLEIAALFHYRFIRIHPFDDGNGRMARILMNLILMKYAYPPVIIKTQEKADYFRALQKADGGDEITFINYIGAQLIRSLEIYVRGAKGESIEELDDVDKQIAVLKAKLSGEPQKVIYNSDSSNVIFDRSITELISAVFSKLTQFHDLFNSVDIQLKMYNGKEEVNFQHSSDGDEVIGGMNFYIAISDFPGAHVALPDMIYTEYKLAEFLKAKDKVFDIKIDFTIFLRQFDFMFESSFTKQQVNRIYYHEGKDSQRFQKIANEIAASILKQIETKLAE